jgi:NNP family nitrate/nitrite transporter-like MFS transporter
MAWQGVARLWALLLLYTAAVFWFGTAEDPKQAARRASGQPAALLARQVESLRRLQVWCSGRRLSLIFSSDYYLAMYGTGRRFKAALEPRACSRQPGSS